MLDWRDCPVVERVPERVSGKTSSFDLFITTDRNLRNQQDLSRWQLAVIVVPTTRWPQIQRHAADVLATLASIQPGEYRELSW